MQAVLVVLCSATTTHLALSEVVQRQSGGSHPWLPAAVAVKCKTLADIWSQTASLFILLFSLQFCGSFRKMEVGRSSFLSYVIVIC